ncbi:MAG: hypothetical protein ACKOS8_19720 [Gemmataceae bacterium]
MSYAYRIEVKESRLVEVSGKDSFTTRIEVVDVLPPGEMQAILERKLAEDGYAQEGDLMVKAGGDVEVRIHPGTREVTVSSSRQATRQVDVKLHRSMEAHTPAEMTGANQRRDAIRKDLESEAKEKLDHQAKVAEGLMEQQLRETATRTLKEALPRVREELGRIGHAAQAQALETKARRMGRVERVEHDPQNQSMTIVVKLD